MQFDSASMMDRSLLKVHKMQNWIKIDQVPSMESLTKEVKSCLSSSQIVGITPTRQTLTLTSNKCEMHFVEFTPECVASKSKPSSKKVSYKGNPILNGVFINENTYIGCGYDNAPLTFKKEGDKWEYKGSLDEGFSQAKTSKIG